MNKIHPEDSPAAGKPDRCGDGSSSTHKQAAQRAVEHDFAVFLGAALVSEEIQHLRPDLWGEGLMEVVFVRHEVEQLAAVRAAGVEALANVVGVGNDALLKLQAQAVQGGDHLLGGAILLDGLAAELSAEVGPQLVPAAVICRHHQMMFTLTGSGSSSSSRIRTIFNRSIYSRASTMIRNVPFFFRRLW